ncbi:hypothetical protein ACMFMF_003538 [Clarireedia jacksonii]
MIGADANKKPSNLTKEHAFEPQTDLTKRKHVKPGLRAGAARHEARGTRHKAQGTRHKARGTRRESSRKQDKKRL